MNHASLPPEIWVQILQFSIFSSDRPIQLLLNTALVSQKYHHLIFCPENDSAVWRAVAIRLGYPQGGRLEDALYAGNACFHKRTWRQFSSILKAWESPFPHCKLDIPHPTRALRQLPPRDIKEDPFSKRSLELYCVGEGDRKGINFQVKRPHQEDEGCAVIQANNLRQIRNTSVAAVVDPLLDKTIQVKGRIVPNNDPRILYPLATGYVLTESSGIFTIRKIDASTAKLTRSWCLGNRKPQRFTGKGNIVVALVPAEDTEEDLAATFPQPATNLLCLQTDGKDTTKLWEMDTTQTWINDEPYYNFANLKGLHISSHYAVCLVTRHPNASMHKLTGTYFYVHDLSTGELLRPIKFRNKEIERAIAQTARNDAFEDGAPSRPAFTTAFSHDFLITDTIAISGGLGGGLFVWSLLGAEENPMYCIPVPSGPRTSFLRPYTSITMSTCGRYLGAATSDRLYIFDMVNKSISAVYDNGRKIPQENTYVKNPQDGFPAGIWVCYNDWISSGRNSPNASSSTGQNFWEKRSEGVVYLTSIANNLTLPGHFESLMELLQAPSYIQTFLGLSDDAWKWIILGSLGILICSIWAVLGIGRNWMAPYLGHFMESLVKAGSSWDK